MDLGANEIFTLTLSYQAHTYLLGTSNDIVFPTQFALHIPSQTLILSTIEHHN
jgi:hypothetical protein